MEQVVAGKFNILYSVRLWYAFQFWNYTLWHALKEYKSKKPEKILTTKVDLKKNLSAEEIEKIIKIFSLEDNQKKDAIKLLSAMYNILIQKDAS